MFPIDHSEHVYCVIDITDLINLLVNSGIFKFCNSIITVHVWIELLINSINNDFNFSNKDLERLIISGIDIDPDKAYATIDNYMLHVYDYFEYKKKEMELLGFILKKYIIYEVRQQLDNFSILMEYR